MTRKRGGLGKGLGALIPTAAPAQSQHGAVMVSVEAIVPNPHQPRHTLDPDQLDELANSIAEHGLIQPLVVTQVDDTFQLIAGERRWRACMLAGMTEVPVIVKETTPQQMLELALVENIQRADLNPLEEAEAFSHLMENFGLTQEQVAQRIGKSRAAVANTVRLLNLPEEVKYNLALNRISEGHARALLSLKVLPDQLSMLEAIMEQGLSVRQTEAMVREILTENRAATPRPKPTTPTLSPQDKTLANQFESRLGTRVEFSRSKKGGKIVIHFYSQEDLQSIYEAIVGEDNSEVGSRE